MIDEPRAVPRNRWDLLDPASAQTLEPTVPVSVVVPCRDGRRALERTLATVAVQRYPAHLLEVVVADDRSDPPLDPAAPAPFALRTVRVEHPPHGAPRFGAGAARNAGAAAAEGRLVLFCDADVLLDPWHIAAHARWHEVSRDVVTMGPLRFVDAEAFSPEGLRAAADDGRLADVIEAHGAGSHEWIERHVARTAGLTRERPDLFRVTVAANLGVGRELLDETGGFRVFGIRGIEDTEFGYRLWTAGAVLIRDPAARAWHQGARSLTGAERERSLEARAPFQAAWLPEGGFREDGSGGHPRPRTAVEIGDGAADDVAACVETVLSSSDTDLLVCVPGAEPGAFPGHSRVLTGVTAADALPWSPLRLELPPSARLTRTALAQLRQRLDAGALGALHVLLPGSGELAHLRRTRAIRRARRAQAEVAAASPAVGTLDPLIGELFGEEWTAGEDVGVVVDGVAPRPPARRRGPRWRSLAAAGLRGLRRARSPDDLRRLARAARRSLR